jgi:hypothetical protein
VLVQFLERPGHHVPDKHSRREGYRRRDVLAHRPGEDLHLDITFGELSRDLDHIDIEPAGVPGTRLVER